MKFFGDNLPIEKKKTVRDISAEHTNHYALIMSPLIFLVGLAALLSGASVFLTRSVFDMQYAYAAYIVAMACAIGCIPLAVFTAARAVEYDRIVTSMLRSNVRSWASAAVTKYTKFMCHTTCRRWVMAFALSTLKMPPKNAIEKVNILCTVNDDYKKVGLFTKEWWLATFTPAPIK